MPAIFLLRVRVLQGQMQDILILTDINEFSPSRSNHSIGIKLSMHKAISVVSVPVTEEVTFCNVSVAFSLRYFRRLWKLSIVLFQPATAVVTNVDLATACSFSYSRMNPGPSVRTRQKSVHSWFIYFYYWSSLALIVHRCPDIPTFQTSSCYGAAFSTTATRKAKTVECLGRVQLRASNCDCGIGVLTPLNDYFRSLLTDLASIHPNRKSLQTKTEW